MKQESHMELLGLQEYDKTLCAEHLRCLAQCMLTRWQPLSLLLLLLREGSAKP